MDNLNDIDSEYEKLDDLDDYFRKNNIELSQPILIRKDDDEFCDEEELSCSFGTYTKQNEFYKSILSKLTTCCGDADTIVNKHLKFNCRAVDCDADIK